MLKENVEKELTNIEYDLWEFEDDLTEEQKKEMFKIRQKILAVIMAVRDWNKQSLAAFLFFTKIQKEV